jgi:lipoate-protein ligase B
VNRLRCAFLGRVPYREAAGLQERLVDRVRRGEAGDTLLLLTHPAVITLGSSADPGHVLLSAGEREALGVELHRTGRGGDVTYHGPGQLVGYPIVALTGAKRDAHRYLRDLEAGLIATASAYGVGASRLAGLTGVWVGGAKLAALGVRIGTGWITSHGFALNCGADLSGFDAIVPCGIGDRPVTSLSRCLGRDVAPEDAAGAAAAAIASALGYEPVWDDGSVAAASDWAISSAPSPGGGA